MSCKFMGLSTKIWNGVVLACAGLEGKAWRSQAQGRRMEALGFGAEAWRCDGPCARRKLALGWTTRCVLTWSEGPCALHRPGVTWAEGMR
ncbi:unnamed protein product [Prunus armeniaca]